jgi:hypothetical protein
VERGEEFGRWNGGYQFVGGTYREAVDSGSGREGIPSDTDWDVKFIRDEEVAWAGRCVDMI